MSPETIEIVKRLSDQGLSAGLLFVAVYFLSRMLKLQYDTRIKTLEIRSDACEADRKDLSRRIYEIQQERIGILEKLLKDREE